MTWIDTIRDALASHIESEGRGAIARLSRDTEIPDQCLRDFAACRGGILVGPFERLASRLGYRLAKTKSAKKRPVEFHG